MTSFESKTTYAHSGTFYSLCANPANGRVYCGSSDYAVHVFDVAAQAADKKEPIAAWARHENYVSALAYVPRPPVRLVVSGSFDRSLIWWDADWNADRGQPLRSVPAAHDGWIRGLAALADGGRLASVGDDMLLKLWETDTGNLAGVLEGHARRTPQGHVTALYAVAASPDGQFLASGDRIGEVRVWEVATQNLAQVFQVPILYTYDPRQRKRSIGGIRSLAFSPDSTRLAVGGIGQVENVDGLAGPAHVELWDWRRPAVLAIAEAEGHAAMINHLAFTADGRWLFGAGGGSDDGLLAAWDAASTPSAATAAVAAGDAATGDAAPPAPSGGAETEPGKPPALGVQRIKSNGHIHQFCLNESSGELYAAGHGKLEVWTRREPA